MVTLLIGKKGSGKTKRLIQEANAAVEASSGSVVVMEKGAKLTYDLTHKARLIDTDVYSINSYEMLYGFLCGVCAGNYDVTDIFVDSTFKIVGDDPEKLSVFIKKANALAEEAKTSITFLISSSRDNLPNDIEATLEEM